VRERSDEVDGRRTEAWGPVLDCSVACACV
jgi:hypothetical protein